MLVLMVLVWVALVLWVYRDASRRGMNAWLWVVIVFFFHLLGIIAYLIARGMRAD
jgi:phospholipase D-like protein